jgi:hypothetical protein
MSKDKYFDKDSHEYWDNCTPEGMSRLYQGECKLTRGLRDEIKQFRRIIFELAGGQEEGNKIIDSWYDALIRIEDDKRDANK